MGMAYYRERGYANASEAFEKAAVASRGTALEAASKLGLANCAFREAMDAPPDEAQQMLRRVLRSYEELSANADAKFNADVVRRRLAELRERESRAAPPMPSAHKKATGAHDIVEQGGVPEKTKAERVERDW
jgi:tetratricopeptide (TPR) repeat protein